MTNWITDVIDTVRSFYAAFAVNDWPTLLLMLSEQVDVGIGGPAVTEALFSALHLDAASSKEIADKVATFAEIGRDPVGNYHIVHRTPSGKFAALAVVKEAGRWRVATINRTMLRRADMRLHRVGQEAARFTADVMPEDS